MNAATLIAIVVAVLAAFAIVLFIVLARSSDVRGAGELSAETKRRDGAGRQVADSGEAARVESEARERAATPVGSGLALAGSPVPPPDAGSSLGPWVPPDRDAIDTSRREFFNRAIIGLMGAGLASFAAASFVAFLWPTKTGGFGGKISVGRLDDVKAGIVSGSGFFYAPEARAWITSYPAETIAKAEEVYPDNMLPAMKQGIIASYQKCPHLGCRVPSCPSSQWFECGCHGSQYNRVGEKKAGPAPRGLDHFPVEISGSGDVVIDTGTIITGQPIGINTTGQEAEGPHCVGGSEH